MDSVPDREQEIIPIRDCVAGPNHGDNIRHLIVRTAFLNQLVRDERVQELFRRWWEITGLEAAVQRVTGALDELARLASLQGRDQVLDVDSFCVDENDAPYTEEMMGEAASAFEQVFEAFDRCADYPLAGEAKDFVLNLGLNYAWLAVELTSAFTEMVEPRIRGGVLHIKKEYVALDLPVPPTTYTFSTREGEGAAQALTRFLTEVQEVSARLKTAITPRGTVPAGKQRQKLERDAVWFYRNKVRRETIQDIATDVFGEAEDYPHPRRKDIREGIERAERLLRLSQYTY